MPAFLARDESSPSYCWIEEHGTCPGCGARLVASIWREGIDLVASVAETYRHVAGVCRAGAADAAVLRSLGIAP